MKKMASSRAKGCMSLRAGSERLKHRLLEPTYSASSPGATTAACGTLEYSAALRDAICGVRAPPQTSALGCPWAAHARTGRCRGAPPSKTTDPPQIIALAAGTLARCCLPRRESRTLRRQRGGALRPPPPAPPPLRPSPTSARPAARSTPPWPRISRLLLIGKKTRVTDVYIVDSAVETMTSPGLNHLLYFL